VDGRGLTLPEVLVAMLILTIGLLGVAGTVLVSNGGIVAGLTGGQTAVERGWAVSMATMLAQERLEQAKRLAWTLGPPVVDQIGPTPGPPPGTDPSDPLGRDFFRDEPFGDIDKYPAFAREVRVLDAAPGANLKTISVTVRYRSYGAQGFHEERLTLRTIVAARP
jgi:prepilin-type N-terminal cleavage/methylation domain-containing protein